MEKHVVLAAKARRREFPICDSHDEGEIALLSRCLQIDTRGTEERDIYTGRFISILNHQSSAKVGQFIIYHDVNTKSNIIAVKT